MKTYYCVMTEFYDNGQVKAAIITRQRKEKPENTSKELIHMDAYEDWFEDKAEAERFLAEARIA